MLRIRNVQISYSGPQILADLVKATAQVAPSTRIAFLPIYVLQLVLRWLLVAPRRLRETFRQYLKVLRIRRRSRVPRMYFAEGCDTGARSARIPIASRGGVRRMPLRDFVRTRCPSLLKEYRPSRLLFNGHLQTAYGAYGDFSAVDKVVYDRKLIRLRDGGTLSLDFTPPDDERRLPDDTPIVVTFHGLTGGSNEAYIRSIIVPATAPREEGGLGYRAVVVNFRGCAGTPVTSEQLYHCGNTDDARQALMFIAKRYPRARLIGLGFSLGANVLIRYLAQEGDESRLVAGCALGCPWDLQSVSYKLSKGAWIDRMYSRTLAHNMATLIRRNVDKLANNPKLSEALPYLLALPAPTLWDFDTYYAYEEKALANRTFESPGDFYRWASSHYVLSDVRVPLLAINADDDPIVRDLPTDVGGNPLVSLVVTRGGGHLGWFASEKEGVVMRRRRTRWVKKPVLEWLRAVGEELAVDLPRGRGLCANGEFTTEFGRTDLGYKEVEGGGKFRGETLRIEGMVSGF